MIKVKDGIVFSNDILRIMQGQNALDFDYTENGLIIPTKEQIKKARDDFEKDVDRIFKGKATIFSEEEMDDFMYEALEDSLDYPIISLDKIYFAGKNDSYFLDCTRLEGSEKMISRKKPNDSESVLHQLESISESLKLAGKNEIILVDDVVFSGNVVRGIIDRLKENDIKVVGIRTAIATEESYQYFTQYLDKGLKCGCLLGVEVIDEICERDFYFGIAQSGISVLDSAGKVLKSPYFKPFGDPVKRASVPKQSENIFSNGCIMRSMYLWNCIEKNSGKPIYISDMPEKIVNTSEADRVLSALKKGLMYYEKDANRDYGECR